MGSSDEDSLRLECRLAFAMDVKSSRNRARVTSRTLVLALSASLGAINALLPTTAAQQAQANAQERTRLLKLQGDATTQLQQAARAGAPADQVRRALLDASRNLEGLSGATGFDSSLRSELRRAASELTALASQRDTLR